MSRFRGIYRGVFSRLFDDDDYQALSAPARLTFLTLRLCAQAGPAAIFRYHLGVLEEQTGLPAAQLEQAFRELEAGRWIVREGRIVWIRNGLRHDPHLRLSDPKHVAAVERAVASLPKLGIVLSFCDYYGIARPFKDPSKTLDSPSEESSEQRVGAGKKEKEDEDRGGVGGGVGGGQGGSGPSEAWTRAVERSKAGWSLK